MKLGIAGYAGTGKDEIAKVLEEEYGFQRIGMSDALNEYLMELNPIITVMNGEFYRYVDAIRDFGYVTAKKRFPEVRRLLQVFGTEVGRAIDPNIWVKERDKRITAEHCVTTGIRFQEEIDACDVLVWVEREGYGPVNDHVSDSTTWIKAHADFVFYNDGTLEDLQENASHFGRYLTMNVVEFTATNN